MEENHKSDGDGPQSLDVGPEETIFGRCPCFERSLFWRNCSVGGWRLPRASTWHVRRLPRPDEYFGSVAVEVNLVL